MTQTNSRPLHQPSKATAKQLHKLMQHTEQWRAKREADVGEPDPPLTLEEFEAANRRAALFMEKTQQQYPSHGNSPDDPLGPEVAKLLRHTHLFSDLLDYAMYAASASNDFRVLHNAIYQTERCYILGSCCRASGSHPAGHVRHAISGLAIHDHGLTEGVFPPDLSMGNRRFSGEVAGNLFLVAYYGQNERRDYALHEANHFLNKKQITRGEIHMVRYGLALLDRDATLASECLQEMCKALQRSGDSKRRKCHALQVHGWYHLARVVDPDFFVRLAPPEHPSFFTDYEQWQAANGYPTGEAFYVYPEELDYANRFIHVPFPTRTTEELVHQGHVDLFEDTDQFQRDLARNMANT